MNLEPLDDTLRVTWDAVHNNPQLYGFLWRIFPHDKVKQLKSEGWKANKDNILYFNEHVTATSNRFIFSKNSDFTIGKNFLKREPEYKEEDRKNI